MLLLLTHVSKVKSREVWLSGWNILDNLKEKDGILVEKYVRFSRVFSVFGPCNSALRGTYCHVELLQFQTDVAERHFCVHREG